VSSKPNVDIARQQMKRTNKKHLERDLEKMWIQVKLKEDGIQATDLSLE